MKKEVRSLLPEYLDDYVANDNSVRIVGVFANEPNLAEPEFDGIAPAITGRTSNHRLCF